LTENPSLSIEKPIATYWKMWAFNTNLAVTELLLNWKSIRDDC